jgi:hypothetical protein
MPTVFDTSWAMRDDARMAPVVCFKMMLSLELPGRSPLISGSSVQALRSKPVQQLIGFPVHRTRPAQARPT